MTIKRQYFAMLPMFMPMPLTAPFYLFLLQPCGDIHKGDLAGMGDQWEVRHVILFGQHPALFETTMSFDPSTATKCPACGRVKPSNPALLEHLKAKEVFVFGNGERMTPRNYFLVYD